MLRTLIAKDLRRAWRNPLPWLIHLAMPLLITALIGLAFGRGGEDSGLGRIKFALVDEDDSPLTQFLRGGVNQGEGARYLDPVVLDRATALAQINANQLSAAVIIPPHFTRDYLGGHAPVTLELVKNPAQSIHPAVLEELLGALVTGLNAVSRNFQSEFPDWQAVFKGEGDYRRVAELIVRAGDRVKALRQYVNPPLVMYTKEVRANESKPGPGFNLFGYLLVGLATMFFLFLATNGMADLQRELAQGTFERYHTLRHRLWPFLAAKALFVVIAVLLGAAIMLGGGGAVFRIHWQHPWALAALVLAYAGFAAGLVALFAALVPDERRANALANIVCMGIGLAGGCAFAPEQLPAFLRVHISPLLPSFWMTETLRILEFRGGSVVWGWVVVKLVAVAAVFLGLAAALFRRRFAKGLRA